MSETRRMEGRDQTADSWRPCTGEVAHLVQKLRWRRRANRIRQGSLVATLVLIVVFGNYFYSDVATELSVKATGSPCDHYTQELRAFYCDGTRGELETKFWEHLSKCRDCQRDFSFYGSIGHAGSAWAAHHKSTRRL